MTDQISAQEFRDAIGAAEGTVDWQVLPSNAEVSARFQTGSFATGVEFVNKIGELADAANHHPDVDLRYAEVTVRLTSHDIGGLSQRDANLARQISEAARDLGVTSATRE